MLILTGFLFSLSHRLAALNLTYRTRPRPRLPQEFGSLLSTCRGVLGTTSCDSGRSKTSRSSVESLLLSRQCVQTRLARRLYHLARLGSGTTSSRSSTISCRAERYRSISAPSLLSPLR